MKLSDLHALAYKFGLHAFGLLCFGTVIWSYLLSDSQNFVQLIQISAFCFQHSNRLIHPSHIFINIFIGPWDRG